MDNSTLKELYAWFSTYTKRFYTEDEDRNAKIALKEEHSLIVARHCKDLAIDLGLNNGQTNLAEALGLLHDVGRFMQVKLYNTFRDRESEDHAILGIKELLANGIDVRVGTEEWNSLSPAIQYHNKIAVPQDLPEINELYCKIIRDADKLDIFRVVPPSPSQEVCTSKLWGNLMRGELINYKNIKTPDDFKIARVGWIYDINFAWTLKQLKKYGYIERILDSFKPSPIITDVRKVLQEFLNRQFV
jgi:hypothetical protein